MGIDEKVASYRLNDDQVARIYQQRVFAKVIKEDSLIVLPTGLGKTFIAMMLSIYLLNQHPGSRVVFLAPTKPLVVQHQDSFSKATTIPAGKLHVITGEIDPDKRSESWGDAVVAFMTPETLRNDLQSGKYSLEGTCLIIYDEAHRAVGDYAYTAIASENSALARPARVLAMTASPGVSKEKIEEVMAGVGVDAVIVKNKSDPDVVPYFHQVKVEKVYVDLPPDFVAIRKILAEELEKVENFMDEKGLVKKKPKDGYTRKDMIRVLGSCQSQLQHAPEAEKAALFTAIKIIAIGMRLSHAIELIETQGVKALHRYLDSCEKEANKPDSKATLRIFVQSIYKERLAKPLENLIKSGVVHPKMHVLTDELLSFTSEAQDSRVLVFASFRDTVSQIVKHLKENGLERVSEFVGQGKSGTKKGMTQKQQVELLESFHDGRLQVLVATSVAEEGLDIGECDLVVFYDMIPSAIRAIQRRGRTGRKRQGKVVVLIAKGTRDETYLHVEKWRERAMRNTLGQYGNAALPARKSKTLDDFKEE